MHYSLYLNQCWRSSQSALGGDELTIIALDNVGGISNKAADVPAARVPGPSEALVVLPEYYAIGIRRDTRISDHKAWFMDIQSWKLEDVFHW